jgi:hypothetical protein
VGDVVIHPHLERFAVPIESLTPWPGNPNEGDVGAVAVQLDTHGQHKPIVVQAYTGRIVAGNHRWYAARHLGWTHIAAIRLELTDAEAEDLLVGDNEPARRSRDDAERLEAILRRLHGSGRIERAGYTAEDLDDLVRARLMAGHHPDPEPKGTTPQLPKVVVKLAPSTYEVWCALVAERECSEADLFAELVNDADHLRGGI